MERVSRYRDFRPQGSTWTVCRFSPLTIAFLACLAMLAAFVIYIIANPAVDAGMLAGR